MLSPMIAAPAANRSQFQRGDQVIVRAAPQAGQCEVLALEAGGLVRIRGLAWPAGFSALAIAANLQRVSHPSAPPRA